MLQRAFGERVSFRVRDMPLKDDEATEWARAEMLRRARELDPRFTTTISFASMAKRVRE